MLFLFPPKKTATLSYSFRLFSQESHVLSFDLKKILSFLINANLHFFNRFNNLQTIII